LCLKQKQQLKSLKTVFIFIEAKITFEKARIPKTVNIKKSLPKGGFALTSVPMSRAHR
jgi:hypothetical protein